MSEDRDSGEPGGTTTRGDGPRPVQADRLGKRLPISPSPAARPVKGAPGGAKAPSEAPSEKQGIWSSPTVSGALIGAALGVVVSIPIVLRKDSPSPRPAPAVSAPAPAPSPDAADAGSPDAGSR